MNCLNQEELIRLVLEGTAHQDLSGGQCPPYERAEAHLASCAACRAAVEDWRRISARVAEAHQAFDEGHALGRERLMTALAAEALSNSRSPLWKGTLSMKQRVAFSGIAVAAALLLAAWLVVAGRPLSAMEQVAAKVREAKSFSFEMSSQVDGNQGPGSKFYWQAPGTVRLEDTALPEGNAVISVFHYHQPGIEIDEKHKTYQRLPAREGYASPLMAVWKLGSFSGDADKEFAPRKIGDRPARGFRIAADKIDSGLRGTLDIWVDAETDLPVLVEYDMQQPKAKMTMNHFQWNEPFDATLFNTDPPKGYADKTPKPPTLAEIVGYITESLKFYSETMGGHYPRVKMVYGDVTMNELFDKLGIDTAHPTEEQLKGDAYGRGMRSIRGFASINGILRDNADAAYYGKTVGPNDKDKILLRWKLDDGDYRVIYGDLRSETVGAERLKALEGK